MCAATNSCRTLNSYKRTNCPDPNSPSWPFLIYFLNRVGEAHTQAGRAPTTVKTNRAMLGGHEVSTLLMTYTQAGAEGSLVHQNYSLHSEKLSLPATVIPTVLSVHTHSQGTSAQMPLPPDWSQRGQGLHPTRPACKTLNRGKFRIHSKLAVPDNTCWPSKHANQMQTWG